MELGALSKDRNDEVSHSKPLLMQKNGLTKKMVLEFKYGKFSKRERFFLL
jgi:hypothetical protein